MPRPIFSSETDEWSSPPELFAQLDRRYRFTLDPCATPENAKCALYFTRAEDGRKQDWGQHRVFCNPRHSPRACRSLRPAQRCERATLQSPSAARWRVVRHAGGMSALGA